MPIRGYEKYYNIIKKSLPFKGLEDEIIAIDGFWYLKKYMASSSAINDKFNFESRMKDALSLIIDLSEKTEIIWIWDGLEYGKVSLAIPDKRHESLAAAAKEGINSNNVFCLEDHKEVANKLLKKSKISIMTAPYSAMAQCVYFLKEKEVRYIFTKMDALLFDNCTKVINEFSSTGVMIAQSDILFSCLECNLEGFRRFALLCGCELCPTVPVCADKNAFSFSKIIKIAKSETFKDDLISMSDGSEDSYIYKYIHGLCSIIYHPIMSKNGVVECLSNHEVPRDLERLFGKKLPNWIYEKIFTGEFDFILLKKILCNEEYKGSSENKIRKCYSNKLRNGKRPSEASTTSEQIMKDLSIPIAWKDKIEREKQMIIKILSEEIEVKNLKALFEMTGEEPKRDMAGAKEYIRALDLLTLLIEYSKLIKIFNPKIDNSVTRVLSINDFLGNKAPHRSGPAGEYHSNSSRGDYHSSKNGGENKEPSLNRMESLKAHESSHENSKNSEERDSALLRKNYSQPL